MNRWPHQLLAYNEILKAIAEGEKRILVTSPTGGGKSVMMCDVVDKWAEDTLDVAIYTNRKMLIEQMSRVLNKQGIDHGIRAAGYEHVYWPVQLCSTQTEHSRVMKRKKMELHPATRVVVDEAHLQNGKTAKAIIDQHVEEGASLIGFTATPLDLGDTYTKLIVAGNNSSLRDCGALVPAIHYGPDEPDLKGIKGIVEGEDLTEKQIVKAIMRDGIFGRVLNWFNELNPERRASILFAPGVRESIWFCEQFRDAGISAAHIDGENVWIDDKLMPTTQQLRDDIMGGSRDGKITMLCNRFVLREGIDAPWLAHGIFATVFGSLQSCLQSGGRLLRAFPGLAEVTIQDHGGNWWRHGSLNADREWSLDLTSRIVAGLRGERMRAKKEKEPRRCPQCGLVVARDKCRCGYVFQGRPSRPVIQSDGTPKMMNGDIFQPRRVNQAPDAEKVWEKMFWRSKNQPTRTFSQAAALYAMENDWRWPDRNWKYMPREDKDYFRRVVDIPMEKLR